MWSERTTFEGHREAIYELRSPYFSTASLFESHRVYLWSKAGKICCGQRPQHLISNKARQYVHVSDESHARER